MLSLLLILIGTFFLVNTYMDQINSIDKYTGDLLKAFKVKLTGGYASVLILYIIAIIIYFI